MIGGGKTIGADLLLDLNFSDWARKKLSRNLLPRGIQ